MNISPEPGWKRLASLLVTRQGTIMLLGATDCGKTTLARYLVETFVRRGLRTALIDSDIGQSGIGLPGSISMKMFGGEEDLRDFRFQQLSFIGFTNPANVMPLLVAMTRRMTDMGRRGSSMAVVDTTGFISGKAGKALKLAEIMAVRPEHVIAIQREDELRHILPHISGPEIHVIRVSSSVRRRGRSTRSAYRTMKLQQYFGAREQHEHILRLDANYFFYAGRAFRPAETDLHSGDVIGLNRYNSTIALGVIKTVKGRIILVISPLRSLGRINRVVLGTISYLATDEHR